MTTKKLTVGVKGTLFCGDEKYPARVIATDAVGDNSVVLLYKGTKTGNEFTVQCKTDGTTNSKTLYFEPTPVRTFKYVNLYKNTLSAMISDLEDVKRLGHTIRKSSPRDAILKLIYEDGKFVGVEVEEFLNKE